MLGIARIAAVEMSDVKLIHCHHTFIRARARARVAAEKLAKQTQ